MGNRTRMTDSLGTTSYNYNKLNQLVSAGSINYKYDAEGKLIQKTDGSETFDYQYNAYDRLAQVTKNNTEIASYAYDPLGRRASVTENGQATNYLWDGDSLLATYVSGSMDNLYAVGSGIDEVLGVYGEQSQYLHSNHLGSITGITGTDGSVLGMRSYTPYGMMRNTTGTFNTNLGFIGRSQSSTTGLTYIRARYYDASVGRFTRVDPIKDGLNWYGYSYSNPVMYVDPYGLWSITIELYVIVGGGITIAHDENGSYFGGKLGLGLGGKAGSIDNETPRVPEPTPLIQLDPTKRKDANGDTLSEIFPDTYGDDSECSSKQESNLPDFKLGYSWNTNGAFGIGGDYGVAGGVSNNGTQLGFYTNKGGNLFVGTPGIGVNGSFEFGFQF